MAGKTETETSSLRIPRYAILALPMPDLLKCVEIGTFGAKQKAKVYSMKKGDRLILYATKVLKIIGLGVVTGEYYVSDSNIFLAGPFYNHRLKFHGETVAEEDQLDMKDLVPALHATKDLNRWGVRFMSPLSSVDEYDWNLITGKLPKGLADKVLSTANDKIMQKRPSGG